MLFDYPIIAVDFDGTLCENRWPKIGKPNKDLIKQLNTEQKNGAKIILWTCRVDKDLAEAVYWCANHGLAFDAINENIQAVIDKFDGKDPRKIYADEYIDDHNLTIIFEGGFE